MCATTHRVRVRPTLMLLYNDRANATYPARLMFQHYLWKDITGCLIHPHILADVGACLADTSDEVEALVADIGTGTG